MTGNDNHGIDRVLKQVSVRLLVNEQMRRFYLFFLWSCVIYIILFVLARCFALIPSYFTLETTLFPLFIAGALAIIFRKKIERISAAKKIDECMSSEDLMYTAAQIDATKGAYQSIVIEQANDVALKVVPKQVIPFSFTKKILHILGILIILFVCVKWVPQLDPFGRYKAREMARKQRKLLDKLEKETQERLAELKKKATSKKQLKDTEELLKKVTLAFNQLPKNTKKKNMEKLRALQKKLSKLWKHKKSLQMKNRLQRPQMQQSFGMLSKKEKQWKKEMQQGKMTSLKKEMKELAKLAQKLAKQPNGKKKQEAMKKLKQRLKKMAQFMKREGGSKDAQAAISRAMQQLNNGAKMDQNTQKALQSLANSMKLGQRELENMEQSMQELKKLEMAMKATQLARQLNQLNKLQNKGQAGVKGIKSYEDWYKKHLVKGISKGEGKGKGVGLGNGKKATYNDKVKTGFKSEVSKSKLQAGKILMKWNVRGVNKSGEVRRNYLKAVKKVKQGVNEAILKEDVPPGYRAAIKHYFGNIEEK